ncbi:farnesol dehydrogenase-like [Schistocerca serialis cubense]|uniref:farnesol dehydrogenase-like n=1 Tax=Schistocerca serialis cubense TaxID=2023355 RepID=UPI00214E4438|nr:farnesol dehydrogenase-like [Schistocerca serialis cubense]
MDRWCGRIAAVTGAGSGIGLAIVKALFRYGVTVVGMDVNLCKFKDFAEKCGSSNLHALQTDVTKEEDVVKNFCWVNQNMGRLDILVNGAGVFTDRPLSELFYKIVAMGMDKIPLRRVTINSTLESVTLIDSGDNYDGDVQVIEPEIPIFELAPFLSVSLWGMMPVIEQVSPGVVYTDLFNQLQRFKPERLYQHPHLKPEDIANAVIFALGAPPTVQVTEMIVLPVGQKMLGQM